MILLLCPLAQAQPDPRDSVVRKLAEADLGDDRRAEFARLVLVDGLAAAPNGDLYIADQSDHRIRVKDARTGLMRTVAGTGARARGEPGRRGDRVSLDFGPFLAPRLGGVGIVLDRAGGTAYFTDWGNDRVLALDTATGRVTLVAQGGAIEQPATVALFDDRLLYVGTRGGSPAVLEIDLSDGRARRLAPDFGFGAVDEIGVDGSGRVYVLDSGAGRIHRITDDRVSSFRTLADPSPFAPFSVDAQSLVLGDGADLIAVDLSSGAETVLGPNDYLLALTPGPGRTLFGAIGTLVFEIDGPAAELAVGGSEAATPCDDPIAAAQLTSAYAVAADADGIVYLGDGLRNTVFAIDERTGSAETVLTYDSGFLVDLTVDRAGHLYALVEDFTEDDRARIFRVDGGTGAVTSRTFIDAGLEKLAVSRDGSRLAAIRYAAQVCYFETPGLASERCDDYLDAGAVSETTGLSDLALDGSGRTAYLANRGVSQLFTVDTATSAFRLLAGNGTFGFGVDGRRAAASPLDSIAAVDVAFDGTVVFATASQLWRVDPTDPVLEYLAFAPVRPEDPLAAGAQLPVDPTPAADFPLFFDNIPSRIAAGPDGQVYFSQLFQGTFGVYEPVGSSLRLPAGTSTGAGLGAAVSASGRRLAVGTPDDPVANGSGSVAIYRRDDCTLVLEDRIVPPEGFTATGFGAALSLDGDELLVGTRGLDADPPADALGAAFFVREGDRWTFAQAIEPVGPAAIEGFGRAVAFDGPDLLVGAPEANGGDGGGFTFLRDAPGAPWRNTFVITPPAGATVAFGTAVAVDGRRLAFTSLGAGPAAPPGRVELFRATEDTSTLPNAGFALVETPGFGTELALAGDRLLVGAPAPDALGAAYLFDILPDTVVRRAELRPPSREPGTGFGEAVSLDRQTAVVGAPRAPAPGEASGALFGFPLRAIDAPGPGRRAKELPAPALIGPANFQKGLGAGTALAGGRAFGGAPLTGNGRGDAIASRIVLNLSGVAGLWFDPLRPGEGYNVVVAEAGTVVYYYGFDPQGRRLWLVSESLPEPPEFGETQLLRMFEVTDGTFGAPVPSARALTEWGNVRMTLNSVTDGVFELQGAAGSKSARSEKLLGVGGGAAAISGLWFDPALEGEGYNVISSVADTVIYYYGSTAGGERLWLVSDTFAGQPALGEEIVLDMFETRNGTFDDPADPASNLRTWGRLRARFETCGSARFELQGDDGEKVSEAVQLAGTAGIDCVP